MSMFSKIDVARLNWSGVRVAHIRMPPSAEDGLTPTAEPGAIAMGYNGQSGAIVRLASGKMISRDVPPGSIGLTGGEPVQWLRTRRSADVVEVTASPELRQEIASEFKAESNRDLADLHGWRSPCAGVILDRFRAAARGRRPLDDLARDVLVRRLYATVLCGRFGGQQAERSKAGLDRRRLCRVIEFVEACLGDELTMSRIAGVAGLSPFHFSRAFRATTGWAPHQFVSSRRIERARQRLLTTAETVETIALDLGYSNISHFRRQFRAQVGVLPSTVRGA